MRLLLLGWWLVAAVLMADVPPALDTSDVQKSFWVDVDLSPGPIRTDIQVTGDLELAAGESAMIHVPRSEMGSDYSILMRPAASKWFVSEGRDSSGNPVVTAVALDLPAGVYFLSFVSFDKRTHAVHRLVVGGDRPEPVDPLNPKPPGPVTPVVPVPIPSLTGLAKESFDNAMKVPAAVRRSEANKIATILEDVASPVVAGAQTSVFKMLESLDQAFPPAIDEAAWAPWGQEFQKSRRSWQATGIQPKPLAEKLIQMATGVKASGVQP